LSATPASPEPINLYIAYYDSQRKGASVHSPRSCIPGGGWEIQSITQVPVGQVSLAQGELRVNRVLIQKGEVRQLVYYWFQQRGRVITNEYLVKWFIFRDALFDNRTDGALVRVTTLVPDGASIEEADAALARFIGEFHSSLHDFIPD
jgi:EpsI family protein